MDGQPNVSIVNFYYDEVQKKLYLASFADNQKVAELERNPHVALTTITDNGEEHIRVKNGVVRKSNVAVEEIKGKFLTKLPDYLMNIPEVILALILCESISDCADYVLDFEHIQKRTAIL